MNFVLNKLTDENLNKSLCVLNKAMLNVSFPMPGFHNVQQSKDLQEQHAKVALSNFLKLYPNII